MSNLEQLFTICDAIVILDCETSGLDANIHQITELAALRIEKGGKITDSFDYLLKLPEGNKLDSKIVQLTGITDEMLETQGKSEEFLQSETLRILKSNKLTLVAAHNAQFDLQFLSMLLRGKELGKVAFLDTLTVYKDRRPSPHKLENAIIAYGLEGKVQNSHRAIDDVKALHEVLLAMDEEREDLELYINLFGYNPKYGVSGRQIRGVTYASQYFSNGMRDLDTILPVQVYNGRK